MCFASHATIGSIFENQLFTGCKKLKLKFKKKKKKKKEKKRKRYPPQNVRDFSSLIMVVTTYKHWQIIYENSNFKSFSIDSTQ